MPSQLLRVLVYSLAVDGEWFPHSRLPPVALTILLPLSSTVITEPPGKECGIDVPFKAEHFVVS